MKLNYYIIFFFFIITRFVFAQEEQKTLVVFLDNSQSMNDTKAISQCETANYAMQLLAATMDDNDTLHLIQAVGNEYKKYSGDREKAIEKLKEISCSSANEYNALSNAISVFNKLSDQNKYFIMIGDGEWFGNSGKEEPTNSQSDFLNKFLKDEIVDKSKLIYINTNLTDSEDNKFLNNFKSILTQGKILETNSEPRNLQEKIKDIIKELLNIGKNGLSRDSCEKEYNALTIKNKLPLKKIFIIDQGSSNTITISNNNINYDVLKIGNDKLFANFITITPKKEYIPPKSNIKISGLGENYEIYAISNLKVETPPSLEEGVELNGETYTVCKGKDSLRIAIKFKNSPDNFSELLATKTVNEQFTLSYDKKNKELYAVVPLKKDSIFSIKIETKDGTYKKTFTRDVDRKKCDEVTKETNKRKGEFQIDCISERKIKLVYTLPDLKNDEIVKIKINKKDVKNFKFYDTINLSGKDDTLNYKLSVKYGKYTYQDSTLLRHNMCNLMLQNVTDTVSFSMLNKADSIVWQLNKVKINDEKQFKQFKIENPKEGDYYVEIDSNKKSSFKLVKDNSFKGIIANCFRTTGNDKFVFKLKHPQSVNEPIEYKVIIKKTDTGFWKRCKREIIGLLLIILFLIYLYFIITKPRFRKYKGKKAKCIKYRLENGKPKKISSIELKSGFFNRYLNPFGVEKKRIDGMLFKAPQRYSRSRDIILSKETINDTIGNCTYNGDTIDINDEGFFANIDTKTKKKIYSDQRIRENAFIYKKRNNNFYIYEYVLRKSSIKKY